MDLDKFYQWKQHAALEGLYAGDVKISPAPPCVVVYERLVEAGSARKVNGVYSITEIGVAQALRSMREAKRLLNELVSENHKLVRRLVNQLFKKSMSFAEEEDLYSAGMMALVKTLERFDPAKYSNKGIGHSFATYLRHWVRDHVQKDTQNQQTIRHPKGFGMPYSVYKRSEEILAKTGRAATAKELGSYKSKGKEYPITEDLLNKWRSAQNAVVSLDGEFASTKDCNTSGPGWCGSVLTQASRIAHDAPASSKSPESMLDRAQRQKLAEEIIGELSPIERQVLEMMREGDAATRKVAQLLGCKDDKARIFKDALIEKLKKRVGWRE